MDVVTHHTTIAGDFAMTRSQWLIRGKDNDGKPTEVHHHGMEVHRRMPDGTWVFFIDHPSGLTRTGPSRRRRQPHSNRCRRPAAVTAEGLVLVPPSISLSPRSA
jgi:hypothetical protein